MIEDKAIKAFVEASQNRLFNPYHYAHSIKTYSAPGEMTNWSQGSTLAAMQLHKVAIGWFLLNEIDYSYGIGDPMVGEMAARVVHEILSDYDELPEYQSFRGFEETQGDTSNTWEGSKRRFSASFIRRGVE